MSDVREVFTALGNLANVMKRFNNGKDDGIVGIAFSEECMTRMKVDASAMQGFSFTGDDYTLTIVGFKVIEKPTFDRMIPDTF